MSTCLESSMPDPFEAAASPNPVSPAHVASNARRFRLMVEADKAENTARHPVAAVILAAGRSTRMRSKLPKPLHPLCGLPLTQHVIRACRAAGVEKVVVVVGHEAQAVRAGLGENVEYVLQEVPRGTGDAVRAAQSLLADWQGTILVLA